MTKRPINLARLSALRRGFVIGYLHAKRQSRKELRALAQSYDDELVALSDQFDELASAHHEQSIAAATTEALLERAAHPDALLN